MNHQHNTFFLHKFHSLLAHVGDGQVGDALNHNSEHILVLNFSENAEQFGHNEVDELADDGTLGRGQHLEDALHCVCYFFGVC